MSQKLDVMGCPCYCFEKKDDAVSLLSEVITQGSGGYSVAINAEKIVSAMKDQETHQVVCNAIFPSPDGAGATLGIRLLYNKKCIKLDLPRTVLEIAEQKQHRIFFGGSTEDVNKKSVENAQKQFQKLKICGRINGYESDETIIDAIVQADPHVVLLALGSPKQEILAQKINKRYPSAFIVGCGGALDILAERVKRAPTFFIDNHIEWLYRLAQSPSRWRRQQALPVFALKLLSHYFRTKFRATTADY